MSLKLDTSATSQNIVKNKQDLMLWIRDKIIIYYKNKMICPHF